MLQHQQLFLHTANTTQTNQTGALSSSLTPNTCRLLSRLRGQHFQLGLLQIAPPCATQRIGTTFQESSGALRRHSVGFGSGPACPSAVGRCQWRRCGCNELVASNSSKRSKRNITNWQDRSLRTSRLLCGPNLFTSLSNLSLNSLRTTPKSSIYYGGFGLYNIFFDVPGPGCLTMRMLRRYASSKSNIPALRKLDTF